MQRNHSLCHSTVSVVGALQPELLAKLYGFDTDKARNATGSSENFYGEAIRAVPRSSQDHRGRAIVPDAAVRLDTLPHLDKP